MSFICSVAHRAVPRACSPTCCTPLPSCQHPRVQYSSRMWYLKKTKQETLITNIRSFPLSVEEYLSVSKMNDLFVYGGSTELEAAAHFLQTPIRVYYEGNRNIPACSWIVYGEEYVTENAKSVILQWKNENHFEYVNKM